MVCIHVMSWRGLRTKNLCVKILLLVKLKESGDCTQAVRDCNRVASTLIMMPCECIYQYVYFIIVGFIIINYILAEFIFEEKRLSEISENKFS